MKPETYEAQVRCTNCGVMIVLQIPKGTTRADYLAKKGLFVCSNCGCIPRKTGGYI